MTKYFPVVIEEESNGTFSAWVAGLPGVYAAADTRGKAKSAIRGAAIAHLQALRERGRSVQREGDVLLLKGDLDRAHPTLEFTGFAAMFPLWIARAPTSVQFSAQRVQLIAR